MATVGANITLFERQHKDALLMGLTVPLQEPDKLINLIYQEMLHVIVLRHVIQRGLRAGAESELVVDALVKQLKERHYIICWLGDMSYAFVHRTFLEYYCAKHITDNLWEGKQNEDTRVAAMQDLFRRRAPEASWHEVLVLLSGMLRPREQVTFLHVIDSKLQPALLKSCQDAKMEQWPQRPQSRQQQQ